MPSMVSTTDIIPISAASVATFPAISTDSLACEATSWMLVSISAMVETRSSDEAERRSTPSAICLMDAVISKIEEEVLSTDSERRPVLPAT